MTDKLSVAIAAGGTAGHVNPALALAEELRARGHYVRFYGQTRRLEGTLVPQAGFDFSPIEVSGFDRRRPWTLVSALVHLRHERRRLVKMFQDDPSSRPDVAIGFGAYLELPLIQAASKLGIPVALHEQNSVAGLANKRSAKVARLIALGQPSVEETFRSRCAADAKIVFTGNPVRASVLQGDRERGRAAWGIPRDATVLLVFGGSLGAKHLNERLASLKSALLGIDNLYIVQSTGKGGYDDAVRALALTEEESRRWQVRSYIDDMGDALAAADLVLSRAGASSVAEIAALAVPSVLVPYPLATEDHQTTNSRFLVDAGAAVLWPDADIDSDAFERDLVDLIDSPDRRAAMRKAARGLAQDAAAQVLASELEAIAR